MKIMAVICNVALLAFTGFVVITDGLPRDVEYIIFGLLLLFVPIFSLLVLSHKEVDERWASSRAGMRTIAMISNFALFAFACWAIVSQYPHPDEEGVIAYTVIVAVTPIVSLLAIARSGPAGGWWGFHLKGKAI